MNSRPRPCKGRALPAELPAYVGISEACRDDSSAHELIVPGIVPTTSPRLSRCPRNNGSGQIPERGNPNGIELPSVRFSPTCSSSTALTLAVADASRTSRLRPASHSGSRWRSACTRSRSCGRSTADAGARSWAWLNRQPPRCRTEDSAANSDRGAPRTRRTSWRTPEPPGSRLP